MQIETRNPVAIYYFGPFEDQIQAEASKYAYISDLEAENASILCAKAVFCQPRQLTIYQDDLNIHDLEQASFWLFMNLLDEPEDRGLHQEEREALTF
ncbi:DUF1816 domain-containing protein [Lyngbya confervoides BDU141951]|uniref:DUF1816 domain-containing protein n=2 Tax=Lyngbya TaxID=28073 RepID=A0ABD4SZY2_9CYAN|nr:DUF1816 domain-containing protein [Lyngbya confervoides BDU141951]